MIIKTVKFDLSKLSTGESVCLTREPTVNTDGFVMTGVVTKITATELCMIEVKETGTTIAHTFHVKEFTRDDCNPIRLEKLVGVWKILNATEVD